MSAGTMPLDLILLRHGESEGNFVHKHKQSDPSIVTEAFKEKHSSEYRLTDKGIKQARETGNWIRESIFPYFDAYYTSGFFRAMETASLMGFSGAKWEVDLYLRERDVGWIGKEFGGSDSKSTIYSETGSYSKHDIYYYTPVGGESIADSSIRIDAFLDSLAKKHSGKRVLAVCHGNIMRTFKIRLEHLTQEQYEEWNRNNSIDNCQVLWYTRKNPSTGKIASTFTHTSSFIPLSKYPVIHWTPIKDPRFSNEELAAIIQQSPQVIQGY